MSRQNVATAKRILVFGASGYVGSHLVERLLGAGYRVRAVARRREILEGRGWADAEVVEADALEPDTLPAALDGIDVAFYLVHSLAAGRKFAELDRTAAQNVVGAAEAAGVRRIIYLGGLQPESRPSKHLRSRAETGSILGAGAIPVTEFRAGIIIGAGSAAFEVLRDLVNHVRLMVTPRWVRSRTRPIALDDLLTYMVRSIETSETEGRVFDVGGPETLTYTDMIRGFAEVVGKRCRIIPVPVLTIRLSSYWLDLVTAVPTNIVRPLIESLRHDLLPDDGAIRELMPIPLRSYREAIEAALDDERSQRAPARWTEGSLALRRYNPEYSYYSKGTRTETPVRAPAGRVWQFVSSIGGNNGYYHADWLWRLRGVLDRLVGGVGMRRGRRHPTEIRVGDAVDFWRVVGAEPDRRLTLLAEMKLPGAAVLEFEIVPDGAFCTLVTTARFHPAGVAGLLYWYSLVPAHGSIFGGTPRAIARRAEELESKGLSVQDRGAD